MISATRLRVSEHIAKFFVFFLCFILFPHNLAITCNRFPLLTLLHDGIFPAPCNAMMTGTLRDKVQNTGIVHAGTYLATLQKVEV